MSLKKNPHITYIGTCFTSLKREFVSRHSNRAPTLLRREPVSGYSLSYSGECSSNLVSRYCTLDWHDPVRTEFRWTVLFFNLGCQDLFGHFTFCPVCSFPHIVLFSIILVTSHCYCVLSLCVALLLVVATTLSLLFSSAAAAPFLDAEVGSGAKHWRCAGCLF